MPVSTRHQLDSKHQGGRNQNHVCLPSYPYHQADWLVWNKCILKIWIINEWYILPHLSFLICLIMPPTIYPWILKPYCIWPFIGFPGNAVLDSAPWRSMLVCLYFVHPIMPRMWINYRWCSVSAQRLLAQESDCSRELPLSPSSLPTAPKGALNSELDASWISN